MQLITGRTGFKHVFAKHDALINRSILGDGDFIFDGLEATQNGATGVNIAAGNLIMQGRLCEHAPIGSQVEPTIELPDGTQGLKRWDIIVAQYSINDEGIESVILTSVTGMPASNTPPKPQVTTLDNIDDAIPGNVHQMALYEVYIEDYAITSIIEVAARKSTVPIDVAIEYARTAIHRIDQELAAVIGSYRGRVNKVNFGDVVKLSPQEIKVRIAPFMTETVQTDTSLVILSFYKSNIDPVYRDQLDLYIGKPIEVSMSDGGTTYSTQLTSAPTELFDAFEFVLPNSFYYGDDQTPNHPVYIDFLNDEFVITQEFEPTNGAGDTYTYALEDIVQVYVNGLKLNRDEFSYVGNGGTITVTFETPISPGDADYAEIVVI